MPDEPGFEVAAAYVTVSPDTSDFAQALDEELGGLVVAVRVMPDASDLQAAVDQEHITADVQLLASVGTFEDQVGEAVSGMSATIGVGADTAPARAELHTILDEINAARGELFVSADTGAASRQAQSLAEEFSGLSSDLTIGANTSNASAGVKHLTGDLEGLAGAAGHASAGLSGAKGGIASLETHAGSAASAIAGLAGVLAGGLGGVTGVTVVPEMAQFDAMLAEGTGGSQARVTVTPDLADFAQTVHEETGGLTASARLVPDAADFQGLVDEQLGGITATVSLLADGGQAAAQVREFASAAVPELGGITAAAEGAGEAITVSAEAFQQYLSGRAASQAALDALNGITAAADEARASIESDFGDMEAEASRLGEALAEVDSQFLRLAISQFGSATDAELSDMTARFENLYGEMESVTGELARLRGEFDAAGGDFAGLDGGLGGVSGALRAFDENLAGTEEALGTLAGDFFDLQEQASRLGTTVDGLPAALETAFAGYVARADEMKASLAAINDESGTLSGIGKEADVAAGSVGGLGATVGTLAGRLSYMAVDPFMWMLAVPAAIGAVTAAVHDLDNGWSGVSDAIEQTSKATDYNISGYKQAAAQLGNAADYFAKVNTAVEIAGGGTSFSDVPAQFTQQQKAMNEAADNQSSHLATLEDRYNLSADEAKDLAAAVGFSAKQMAEGGPVAEKMIAKIEAYANANIGAQGPVNELSNDMLAFGNDTLTASSRISGMDDAYSLLTGNFVGTQQMVLNVAQGFLTIGSNAAQAGASMTGTNQASIALQQSFFAQSAAIEQTANAMVKQGDSTQQVTSYVNDQIGKLAKLTGGNAEAQQSVTGLKGWEDQLTQSTKDFNSAASAAATTVADQFTAQVRAAGFGSQTTAGYVDGLKTSIENTGTTSQQTADDRERLIKSLENAGLNAKTATGDVDGFIKKIGGIPKQTNWTLTEHATGTWTEQQLSSMIAIPGTGGTGGAGVLKANGGLVLGGSGSPKADDISARLSHREFVVQTAAVDKYGVGMLSDINAMRFGDGGLASVGGSYSGTASGLGSWTQGRYDATANAMANLLAGSAAGAAASARAAPSGTTVGGAAGSVQALARSAAAARGWTGAQWDALNSVEMAEAGWNLSATNPSSGAYGIAQFINGPSEYATYGGNSGTAAGQVTAFENYVAQRYGNPEAAWAHEQQYHWYRNGGRLNPGQSAIVGDGGLPEVVTAGMTGATVTPMGRGGNTVNVNLYGVTQLPSAEWIANIKSEMAYAQIGAP